MARKYKYQHCKTIRARVNNLPNRKFFLLTGMRVKRKTIFCRNIFNINSGSRRVAYCHYIS